LTWQTGIHVEVIVKKANKRDTQRVYKLY